MNNWNNWNYTPQFNYNRGQSGGLFDNIGRKLKTLAKVFFIIQTVFYVVIALVLGSNAGPTGVLIALLIAGFLVFSSWIICSVLYGYGEIIDGIAEIVKNTRFVVRHREEEEMPKKAKTGNKARTNRENATYDKRTQTDDKKENTTEPPVEEETENYITFNCPYCEEELSVSEEEIEKSLFCPYCGQKIK